MSRAPSPTVGFSRYRGSGRRLEYGAGIAPRRSETHRTPIGGPHNRSGVVALAPVWDSYYTHEPDTLALDRHPMPA